MVILTPFLDVLTVLLIFLIVTFSPEEASVQVDSHMKLPESVHQLDKIPHIRVELSGEVVKVNGDVVQGLQPQAATADSWNLLKKILKDQKKEDTNAVLLMADKATSYKFVDLTASLVAAAGYSDIYLLTELKEEGAKP